MPMRSPFPGMDPYLEEHWRDVHQSLVIYARDQVQGDLPDDLRARVEERVFVESESGHDRSFYPDVRVIERPQREAGPLVAESGVAVAEPVLIRIPREEITEGYIEIIDASSGNRVVTVIEFLSPANKVQGDCQELYRQKQRELEQARVSLVEIDLLRSGRRVLNAPAEKIPPRLRTTYQVCVSRGWKPIGDYEIYRVPLRERLPAIRIPLRETDPDAVLDLQALIDQAYRNGRYDDLNYQRDPVPPLDPADAAWADELLRSKGVRKLP